MNRTRALRRRMAGNSSGKRKLQKEFLQSRLILTDVRINLAIGALEVNVAHDRRPAVPGTGNINHVEIVFCNDPVQVHIDEVLPRRCCLLYTSDAADEEDSVDLGGR